MKSKKVKTVFVCQSCGYESPKWLGKCPGCSKWNTFVEEKQEPILSSNQSTRQLFGKNVSNHNQIQETNFEKRKQIIKDIIYNFKK